MAPIDSEHISPQSKEAEAALEQALDQYFGLFRDDLELVREAATHHGVALTDGGMFDRPTLHAYSLRIPGNPAKRQEEINKIKAAKTILWGCMDARQVGQLDDEIQPDGRITNAGGAAQPEKKRFDASVQLARAIAMVNPGAMHILTGHQGVCGGANNFTGGEMKRINAEDPHKEEHTMEGFVHSFADALQASGLHVQTKLSIIDPSTNKFSQTKQI